MREVWGMNCTVWKRMKMCEVWPICFRIKNYEVWAVCLSMTRYIWAVFMSAMNMWSMSCICFMPENEEVWFMSTMYEHEVYVEMSCVYIVVTPGYEVWTISMYMKGVQYELYICTSNKEDEVQELIYVNQYKELWVMRRRYEKWFVWVWRGMYDEL
jgi:hypothetical protein